MKIYRGKRAGFGPTDPGPVHVISNKKVRLLKHLWKWTGFNWGYFGSGPKHLAYRLPLAFSSSTNIREAS